MTRNGQHIVLAEHLTSLCAALFTFLNLRILRFGRLRYRLLLDRVGRVECMQCVLRTRQELLLVTSRAYLMSAKSYSDLQKYLVDTE